MEKKRVRSLLLVSALVNISESDEIFIVVLSKRALIIEISLNS